MKVEIWERLKALRIKKGLTQKELADYLHISFQSVSKWESGKSLPSLDRVMDLSQLYQISIDDLLGNKRRTGFLALLDKFNKKISKGPLPFNHYIITWNTKDQEVQVANYQHLPSLGVWIKNSGEGLRIRTEKSTTEVKCVFCEDTGFDEENVFVNPVSQLAGLLVRF